MLPVSRSRENAQPCERPLGVIGGLEPHSDADFLQKLAAALAAQGQGQPVAAARTRIIVEQCAPALGLATSSPAPHAMPPAGARSRANLSVHSQLNILDRILVLADGGARMVALPSFAAHAGIEELQANSPLPVADMLAALRSHIRSHYPAARRISVLTSPEVRQERLFERYFPSNDIVYAPDG